MFACIMGLSISDQQALIDFASMFSPLVEDTAPSAVLLDIKGCELLFGSPRAIAGGIAHRASQLGYKVRVAIADNPDAAFHAARGFAGITIIPWGKESERLGDLPLKVLYPALAGIDEGRAAEILETLDLWGIRQFSDLASLPPGGLSERLGQDGLKLQELARGGGTRSLTPVSPPLSFEKSIELEHPIDLLEPLSFILGRLVNQLCESLNRRGLATDELRLRLRLEDRSYCERTLRLPFPMRDPKVFLRLLLLEIEANPIEGHIIEAWVDAEPVGPRVIQNGLFIPLAPEPQKLELSVARIAKLVGPGNVGCAELLDTHRPGAFRIERFGIVKKVRNNGAPLHTPRSIVGFRVFRPAMPARVQMVDNNRGPARISAADGDSKGNRRRVYGKVVWAAGPWRNTGDWWADDSWARDEWDVVVGKSDGSGPGTLYRIYRDLNKDRWFIEGMYD